MQNLRHENPQTPIDCLKQHLAGVRHCFWVCLVCITLGSCGGGSREVGAATFSASQAAPQALASVQSALYGTVSPEVAVEQLLDFGEAIYGEVFPGHKPTLTFGPYRYRYYPETGVYLAVAVGVAEGDGLVESGVYVLGGPRVCIGGSFRQHTRL